MMLPLLALLVLAALILTLVAAVGRLPLWIAVLIVVLIQLLQIWPR
jgi:hypothetical protein